MHPILTLGLSGLLFVAIRRIQQVRQMFRFIFKLPGPASWNIFLGHLPIIGHSRKTSTMVAEEHVSLRCFITPIALTLKAIQHVTSNAQIYEKPPQAQFLLSRILGKGMFSLNNKIASSSYKTLKGFCYLTEEALKLRDRLQGLANTQNPVDIVPYLSECTMQIIGLGGFGYDLQNSRLATLFRNIFRLSGNPWVALIVHIQATFPIFRNLATAQRQRVNLARAEMDEIGQRMIQRTKDEVDMANKADGGSIDKASFTKRDILSLLIRANMATDIPENQRLSDEEVIAQIPTFIVAGSETTSTAVSWTILALCKHPEVQGKLRTEVLSMDTENPTMEQLNSLTYLGYVVREVLRLYPPVTQTARMAVADDVIPLSNPIQCRNGSWIHEIPVRKGQQIFVHILGVHQNSAIWGDDANEFRPERWESEVPEAATAVPGVWGNLLTFLGGQHACIGYRFSVIETKSILFALVKAFTFELAIQPDSIQPSPTVVSRPCVIGHPQFGNNMLPVNINSNT
ncbi:cytochrome P450 [Flagelloscypha sp. PMI_526]|nr:cytochrome P450 [Flagelloscypha sp. PMI_526]